VTVQIVLAISSIVFLLACSDNGLKQAGGKNLHSFRIYHISTQVYIVSRGERPDPNCSSQMNKCLVVNSHSFQTFVRCFHSLKFCISLYLELTML